MWHDLVTMKEIVMGDVRTYRLLVGKHVQKAPDGKGSVKYTPGQTFQSENDLLRLNPVGGTPKFELVDESRARRRMQAEGPPKGAKEVDMDEVLETPSVAAPGGQVSQGFQVASHGVEGGVGGIHNPAPQTIGEKRIADLEAKAAGKKVTDTKARAKAEKEAKGHTEDELESLTVPELKELAEDEEVDLKGAHTKADIIKAFGAKK